MPMSESAPRRRHGFSLVELLVALVIAAVLLLVALPGYQFMVLKSTRAAARATLLDVVSRQEQYFVNHKRYAVDLGGLGLPEPYHVDSRGEAVEPGAASYHISLELTDGNYSGAVATPVNRQVSDSQCLAFSLSHSGIRAVSGAQASNPGACW
ncbi:MAG: prepilin-type N-terminal cleavage/methylation domain-containing protein [Halioglobus sp.]|nr:prepilin-type N-terminal cleavage/methylation domain-containing protein [Halioglobus sp.]